jgi:N-methylhydantoinase B
MLTVPPATSTVDPVTFEIISHRLHQITREIGVTLERVGGTVNTTQRHDYISTLYRANGDVLSAGESLGWHVACASFAVKHIIKRFADDEGIDPGDMFLLNDPYVAAIHQSDVYIISPVHFEDGLVAWSATFVHVADIGAMSPGGNSPGATEVCQEGIRIPGIKLIERGKLRRDVFDAITNMTRQPAMVGLDLKCEIAANSVARARIQEMCAQYGADVFNAVSEEMIRYSERILRNRLREIPDGRWSATGYVQTTDTWKVMVTLTKRGDHLLFDFTGTDPQAKVGINFPYHATVGAVFDVLLTLLGWDIPKNHGTFAPFEVIAPEGTIANSVPPAPVSLNTTSGGQALKYVAEAVMAQMVAGSERWRSEVIARALGHRRARHAGINQYGWYYVASMGGLDGGGARAGMDGIDSGGSGMLQDHDVEWFESHYPFLYLFRRHMLDGGGAGKFRGGVGQEVALTIHDAPEHAIRAVAYGVAGLRNSGRGVFGGYPGAPSLLIHHQGTQVREILARNELPDDVNTIGGEAVPLPYQEFRMGEADVLFISNASGGGYGDPLDRDPAAVLRDVQEGLVSEEAAQEVYGVVVTPSPSPSPRGRGDQHHGSPVGRQYRLDEGATEAIRSRLREERQEDLFQAARGGRTSIPDGAVEKDRHPLRENLEVVRLDDGAWVRCVRCGHVLCREEDDWTAACHTKHLSPTRAGALMEPLVGGFVLEQVSCPSCAVVLNTEVEEVAEPQRS